MREICPFLFSQLLLCLLLIHSTKEELKSILIWRVSESLATTVMWLEKSVNALGCGKAIGVSFAFNSGLVARWTLTNAV